MIGDLFDSPWKILIVAVVLIVLFGSKKLPDAARSLGKSMRILKTEVHDLREDDAEPKPARPSRPSSQLSPLIQRRPRWTRCSSRSATSSSRRRTPRRVLRWRRRALRPADRAPPG